MKFVPEPLRQVAAAAFFAALCGTLAAAEDFAPDIEFRSKVRAREMVFETVTGAHVDFHGTPNRKTRWDVKRKNLPTPVKPGEVYRDVEVEAEATSTFLNVSTAFPPSREK